MPEEQASDPAMQVRCAVRVFVVSASGVTTVLSLTAEEVIAPNHLTGHSPSRPKPGTSNLARYRRLEWQGDA
jgi:hypothetical protein